MTTTIAPIGNLDSEVADHYGPAHAERCAKFAAATGTSPDPDALWWRFESFVTEWHAPFYEFNGNLYPNVRTPGTTVTLPGDVEDWFIATLDHPMAAPVLAQAGFTPDGAATVIKELTDRGFADNYSIQRIDWVAMLLWHAARRWQGLDADDRCNLQAISKTAAESLTAGADGWAPGEEVTPETSQAWAALAAFTR